MRKHYSDEEVAEIVHAAQCALQNVQGDPVPSPPWVAVSAHIRESCIQGVRRVRSGVTEEQHHEEWRRFKETAGWRYGAEKNPLLKTHPDMVPYMELPEYKKDKARLFLMIVAALTIE